MDFLLFFVGVYTSFYTYFNFAHLQLRYAEEVRKYLQMQYDLSPSNKITLSTLGSVVNIANFSLIPGSRPKQILSNYPDIFQFDASPQNIFLTPMALSGNLSRMSLPSTADSTSPNWNGGELDIGAVFGGKVCPFPI